MRASIKHLILLIFIVDSCPHKSVYAQNDSVHLNFAEIQGTGSSKPLEVIVRPRKRLEPQQNTPLSLQIFRSKDLDSYTTKDIEDVFNRAPSTNFSNTTDNHRTANFAIRGIGSAVIGAGVDSPTAFYVDGVYLGNPALINFDLLDVSQIEILRGPQGTLYGKNALAGAVNIFHNQPQSFNSSQIELQTGNLDLIKVSGITNNVLIEDKLFSRLALSYLERDGFVKNTVDNSDLRSQRNIHARTSLKYLATSKTDVLWDLDYNKDRPTNTAAGGFDTVLNDEVSIFDPYDEKRDILSSHVTVQSQFDLFQFKSITGFRGLSFSSEGSDFVANNNFQQGQYDKYSQASQEFQWSSNKSSYNQWVAGIYAFYDDHFTDGFLQLFDLAPVFGKTAGHKEFYRASTITSSYALYGDFIHSLNSNWELTTGLRYTYENKSMNYSYFAEDRSNTVIATEQNFSGSESFDNLSPKVSTTYNVNDHQRVYASITRGFKSGGFNNFAVNGSQFAFTEETAWNYEIGHKSEHFSNRLITHLSLFYFDWKDMQVQSFNADFGTTTSNASDASSYGLEAGLQTKVSSKVTLSGEYTYSESTFDDYKDFPNPSLANLQATEDVTGNRVPFASKNSFSLGAQFKQPTKKKLSLTTSLNYVYKSAFFFDARNTLEQPGYGLTNASISLAQKGLWEFSIWGKNIFDERYRTVGVDRGALGKVAAAGEPVTYGVKYKHIF